MKIKFYILGTFLLFSFWASAYQKGKTYDITFLHLNDTHGRYWKDSKGQGGFSAISTLVKEVRGEVMSNGGYLFVVHAGDINTGIPESDTQAAEPDIMGLNRLGVKVMAVGNHEFDKDRKTLLKQRQWANFPFISANIMKNGKPFFNPSVTYSVDGLKLTIVGFTTENTPLISNPPNVRDLDFIPSSKIAKQILPDLRKKSDLLVALTHIGYYPGFSNGTEAPGDEFLAKTYPKLDLIIGGHSHSKLKNVVYENGVPVAQAESYGRYLGRVDLRFKDGNVSVISSKLIPVNLKKKETIDGEEQLVFVDKEIIEDPEMIELLQPYQDKGEANLNVVIGSTDGKFIGDREIIRSAETNLGNLIAYVQTKKTGADIGVMNSGGIRASIESGEVTYKSLLTVQPFSNTLCVADLDGKMLTEYLSIAASKSKGSGGFAQFYGVSFKVVDGKATNISVLGKPIEQNRKYKIAVNSFIAAGGDGYMPINTLPSFVDTGFVDADALRTYFESTPNVTVSEFAPNGNVIR